MVPAGNKAKCLSSVNRTTKQFIIIIIHFFYEMNKEDVELAVTAIIMLRRFRKRRIKRKPRKQWVRAIFKEIEEKGAYYQLIREYFIVQTLIFFTTPAKVSSSLKLHLFAFPKFMDFFQLMNVILKIFNTLRTCFFGVGKKQYEKKILKIQNLN